MLAAAGAILAGLVSVAAFLWSLSEKVSGLGERLARVEGLLEGLRLRPEEPAPKVPQA